MTDLDDRLAVLRKHICCHSDEEIDALLADVRAEAAARALREDRDD